MADSSSKAVNWMKVIKQHLGLQLLILKVLDISTRAKESLTAYDIQNSIHKLTYTFWKPSPGSVYPILETLLEKEQVLVENRDNKDHYILTDAGRLSLEHSLSIKLMTDAIFDSKLYDSFETGSIIFPGPAATQLANKQFTEMISLYAEKEGICTDRIHNHINGIEKEIKKERTREMITGIDKRIHLLAYIKAELEKRMAV